MIHRRTTPRPKAIWTKAFPGHQHTKHKAVQKAPRRKRVNPVSKKRAVERELYKSLRRDYLLEFPWCAWALLQHPPQQIRATEIHHTRGRAGRLFLDTRYWLGVSKQGHDWIHNNMELARAMEINPAGRKLTLLARDGEWGKREHETVS